MTAICIAIITTFSSGWCLGLKKKERKKNSHNRKWEVNEINWLLKWKCILWISRKLHSGKKSKKLNLLIKPKQKEEMEERHNEEKKGKKCFAKRCYFTVLSSSSSSSPSNLYVIWKVLHDGGDDDDDDIPSLRKFIISF